jgi:type 1 glutamine amidotransferase
MPGVDAYPQDFENFVQDWGQVRRSYDALVFYNMHGGATDGPYRDALTEIGGSAQGVVVLHHAILAWLELPFWSDLCGLSDRSFGYHMGQSIRIDVAHAAHPITRDLASWEMGDETYTMADADPGCQVLLTADHPLSMRTIAWTRTHRQSRVFCFQSGHDQVTWGDPNFREVLRRGILWSAHRL